MFLIELLLPLRDPDGRHFDAGLFGTGRDELVERFGGLTAFTRAPAEGLWEPVAGKRERDEIVIFEVMVEQLDREWWRNYRRSLERRFRQDELVVRARAVDRL